MRKLLSIGMLLALTAAPALAARADNEKETDRMENAGTVMEEIMNIPDDIPQDLLDKAECVIVYPSVLKAAFIVGGSYGRGAMACRSGEHFTGPWGAPSMMALEGGSLGFQLGGQATDFVLLVMNPRGARAILSSKVKLGAGMSAAAGPKGRDASASHGCHSAGRDSRVFAVSWPVCGYLTRRIDACGRTMTPMRRCTGKK